MRHIDPGKYQTASSPTSSSRRNVLQDVPLQRRHPDNPDQA